MKQKTRTVVMGAVLLAFLLLVACGGGGGGGGSGSSGAAAGTVGTGEDPGSGGTIGPEENPGTSDTLIPIDDQGDTGGSQIGPVTDDGNTGGTDTGSGYDPGEVTEPADPGDNQNGETPPARTLKDPASWGVVGVIDSSFDSARLSALAGRIQAENLGSGDKKLSNGYTHGENVAQIIGADPYGDTRVTIYAEGAVNDSGMLNVRASMYYSLYARGARIFNQSFGDNPAKPTAQSYPASNAFVVFYRQTAPKDSLYIWAAGNDSKSEASSDARLPALYPELEKGWLVVTAIDSNTGVKASYSNAVGEDAKNWGISAIGDYVIGNDVVKGTSFATPAVTRAAAKVKMQFPWMSMDLVRTTLLTNADPVDGKEVSEVYGWGKLNETKALLGPAKLDKRLAFDENGARSDYVYVAIDEGIQYQLGDVTHFIFPQDITGNAGLRLKSTDDDSDGFYEGQLVLSGKNSYTGNTDIESGQLYVTQSLTGSPYITIGQKGSLIALGTVQVELSDDARIIRGGAKRIVTISGDIENNGGILSVEGGGLALTGNYRNTTPEASVKVALDSLFEASGIVDFGWGDLILTLDNAILTEIPTTTQTTKALVIAKGGLENLREEDILTSEKVSTYISMDSTPVITAGTGAEERIEASWHRKTTQEAALSLAYQTEALAQTGSNIDRTLDKLAETGEDGALKQAAAQLLATTAEKLPMAWDSLSGEIHASALHILFRQTQTLNRTLSERIYRISEENERTKAGFWFESTASRGTIRASGWAGAKTTLQGAEGGYDRRFGKGILAGIAFTGAKGKADFSGMSGKNRSEYFSASLYGGVSFENGFYVLGRMGAGQSTTKTSRSIVLAEEKTTITARHKDMSLSLYAEAGKRFRIREKVTVTPYIGILSDTVKRGSIRETKHAFALNAPSARYRSNALALGLRVSGQAGPVKLTGHVSQLTAIGNTDLSYEARISGDPAGPKWKIKGIPLPKHTTTAGIGAEVKISENCTVDVSYDLSLERGKTAEHRASIGFRYRF
jgi:outer membrane autotransporter protein